MFLLDTNILSEATRAAPDTRAIAWIGTLTQLIIPAVVVYELSVGIQQLPQSRKRDFLEAWLEQLLNSGAEIVPLDVDAALASATIATLARSNRRNIEHRDLLILGVAKSRGLTIATRNVAHFRGLGVAVYNPFDDTLER